MLREEEGRSLLIFTIDKILVYDNGVIRIYFRYQNEFAAVRGLEEITAGDWDKSRLSKREQKAVRSFLETAREEK